MFGSSPYGSELDTEEEEEEEEEGELSPEPSASAERAQTPSPPPPSPVGGSHHMPPSPAPPGRAQSRVRRCGWHEGTCTHTASVCRCRVTLQQLAPVQAPAVAVDAETMHKVEQLQVMVDTGLIDLAEFRCPSLPPPPTQTQTQACLAVPCRALLG